MSHSQTQTRALTHLAGDEAQRIHELTQLHSLSLRQLREKPFPPKETLIDPWFYTGQSALVWAEPGVGKTWFVSTLALMIAGGGKALGWTAPKPRRVLFVDGEMSGRDIKRRFEQLLPAIEGLDEEQASKNLTILARTLQSPSKAFIDIADPANHNALLKVIMEKYKPDVVVLDNYSVLSESMRDENSAGEFRPVCSFLLKLKQAGIATILVHHSGKSGTTFRGTSTMATTFEVILGLKKGDDAVINQTCAFEIQWEKYREKRTDATEAMKVWLEEGSETGGLQWGYRASEERELVKMLSLLKSCDYATQGELATAMKVSDATVSRLKKKAIAEARITKAEWASYMNTAREESVSTDEGF